jgi:cytochrome P450
MATMNILKVCKQRKQSDMLSSLTNENKFAKDSLETRMADKGNARRDFTYLMVEAMKEDKVGNYLTVPESQVASVVLLVAGTDTTSNSMTFAAFLLSKHPHVQERLYQELVKIIPDKNAAVRSVLHVKMLVWNPNYNT